MNLYQQIETISQEKLEDIVKSNFQYKIVEITTWSCSPINYPILHPNTGGIYRFWGDAYNHNNEKQTWSLIIKVVHLKINDNQPHKRNFWKREALAYKSGFLDSLPNSLKAPMCFDVEEKSEDTIWLWLEEITDIFSSYWPLTYYSNVARNLGHFNGKYLQRIPTYSWLAKNCLRTWVEDNSYIIDVIECRDLWKQPIIQRNFPVPIIDDILRLWTNREVLLNALDQLPQTLCHGDAYPPNLFAVRNKEGYKTVAIDWTYIGIGAIGEEISQFIVGSLMWFKIDVTEALKLEQIVFKNYIEGLRESGWNGNEKQVRFGYTASAALGWGIAGLFWLNEPLNEKKYAFWEKRWGHPIDKIIGQWAKVTYFLISLADEAQSLLKFL